MASAATMVTATTKMIKRVTVLPAVNAFFFWRRLIPPIILKTAGTAMASAALTRKISPIDESLKSVSSGRSVSGLRGTNALPEMAAIMPKASAATKSAPTIIRITPKRYLSTTNRNRTISPRIAKMTPSTSLSAPDIPRGFPF